jgi:hypothetical protein
MFLSEALFDEFRATSDKLSCAFASLDHVTARLRHQIDAGPSSGAPNLESTARGELVLSLRHCAEPSDEDAAALRVLKQHVTDESREFHAGADWLRTKLWPLWEHVDVSPETDVRGMFGRGFAFTSQNREAECMVFDSSHPKCCNPASTTASC